MMLVVDREEFLFPVNLDKNFVDEIARQLVSF